MGIFNKKLTTNKQSFTVPITLQRESEADAKVAAGSLAVIAGYFATKELAAVAKALNNPTVRALIKAKL
jgi:phosphopantetheinyl transferase (holo-ACP synthase)